MAVGGRDAVRNRLVVARVLFFGLLGAAVFAVWPASSSAVINPPTKLGNFKVLEGHFRQDVSYNAFYTRHEFTGCYIYTFHDQGDANYDITYADGRETELTYKGGSLPSVKLNDLRVTGKASRGWEEDVRWARTDDPPEHCKPPDPPRYDGPGCGTVHLQGKVTGLRLLAVRDGRLGGGPDAALFGSILGSDPFTPCPSDSIYSAMPVPVIATDGMKELKDARVGDTVKLKGAADASGPGPDGMFINGDWVKGRQDAAIDFALNLKRVKG